MANKPAIYRIRIFTPKRDPRTKLP
jgi:hypothetical protein